LIDISLQLSNIFKTQAALQVLARGGLPKTAEAVRKATDYAANAWIDEAGNTFQYATGAYTSAIRTDYPLDTEGLFGKVRNRLPYAKYLEEGTGPFDLKKILETSHQVRVVKNRKSKNYGKRYLVIPFRHGTPKMSKGEAGKGRNRATMPSMPLSVYTKAKKLDISRRIGIYYEASEQYKRLGPGERVTMKKFGDPFSRARRYFGSVPQAERQIYKWGERLKNLGEGFERYEGMYRFPIPRGSMYITFRVMMEGAAGWMHPGIPRLEICKKTADRIRPEIEQMIKSGFSEDIKAALEK
jgi:hypothetical protein